MIPLDPLLKRLAGLPGMESGCKRLVVVLGQLGDFEGKEWDEQAFHQASAIHLQAAMLTGIQTTTNRATTGIGLVLSAFTVAAGAPSPHH